MKRLLARAWATAFLGSGEMAIAHPGPPLTLTALADLATIYWRYDCTRQPNAWSLGLRVAPLSATTGFTFKAGTLLLHGTLQPGQTRWLPFRTNRVQTLRVLQRTEAGTLRALVTVDFGFRHGVPHCYSYAPPRLSVQQYPR